MISSNDLSTLFSSTRREAQSLLPHLVRRLIFASCSDQELTNFSMPAGDDVRVHGWDGRLTYTGDTPFVPSGESVWEMGVSSDPKSKADEDYAKRTANPRGCTPANTRFVFVTPHVWPGREAWAESKNQEGTWAEVRAIDGATLASWLEQTPAIALWIADALGRPIRGLRSLDRFWESEIRNRYAPNITPSLIIGGREDARSRLVEFLQSPSGSLCLIGETAEEAAAFAAATCKDITSDNATGEKLSRLLFMSEPSATEHVATLSRDHIVILTDPAHYPTIRSEALAHLHFVVCEKRDARANKATDSIDLGSLVRSEVVRELVGIGMPKDDADRAAGESKGSLHAVLWMIAQPERGALDWATGRNASELAPLVLAGQWAANDHPDHEIVAGLAQREYQEVKQTLSEWSGPGNPLERRGTIWDWKAWGFAWTRLAPSLQRDDIERYFKITNEVLGTADPALELPPEDRWLANIRGKVHRYSPALRKGLAQSLVLLALNGDLLPDTNGQDAVSHFVRSLLLTPEPAARWISVAQWLPDLAEAAPDSFLDALEQLTGDTDAIKDVFTEGGMFGSSPHTHVLWALERLAWSDEHFGRVVLALGRLAAVDPGGKLMNRPSRSLRMLLLPWHPGAGSTVEDRIGALRLLFAHVDDTAWRCAASLLPQSHDIGDPFVRPKWREWAKDANEGVTRQDYWSFQEQLVDLLLEHAGLHGKRWTVLVQAAPELREKHPELGDKVIAAINALIPTTLSREDAYQLGDAARALVMRHENMHDSDWAMKGDDLDTFKQIRDHLRPRLRRDRDRWLFSQWPEVLREYDLSMEERHERLSALRSEAVEAVLQEENFDALIAWADEVEQPETLGNTLAAHELTEVQMRQLLSDGLEEVGAPYNRPPAARLAYGYVASKARSDDDDWLDQTLTAITASVSHEAVAFFLQALPYGVETWAHVDLQEEGARSTYWREIGLHVLTLEECEYALPHLVAANRPYKIIDLVAMLVHDIKNKEVTEEEHARIVQLAKASLDAQIDHLPKDEYAVGQSTDYEINQILDYLDSREIPRQELARWEWVWLPLISEGRRGLRALQAELSEDPELFADLLKWVYRPRNADPDATEEVSPEDRNRAHLAHRLLEAWVRVPGLAENAQPRGTDVLGDGLGPINPAWTGAVDEPALTAWVERAIELATASNRFESCMHHIGRQFAYAPADSNGVWPCVEVRKTIERLRSDELEHGMILGVSNRRGAHTVAHDGEQEFRMASQFREWCEKTRLEYPRTGTVLRRLAEDYEAEAKREIERGRLHEYEG